jgi:hypothetical protein
MDHSVRAVYGRPLSMRSGMVFVVELEHVWAMTLPFEDAPQE